MDGRTERRSRTPAQVQLPLSMPNDELVLTRRTDQRKRRRRRGHPDTTSQIARKDYRQLPPGRVAAGPIFHSSTVSPEGNSYMGGRDIMN